VTNNSATDTGTSTLSVPTFNLANSNDMSSGAKLGGSATGTVHIAFTSCGTSAADPTLTLPDDMTVEATGPSGAVVDFAGGVSASDFEGNDLTDDVECTPASGSTFPLGTTTVNCSVTDDGGRTTAGSFDITVVDTTPPALTCGTPTPVFILNQTSAEVSATAVDLVDGSWTVETSVSTSTIGSHSVELTATDAAGNEGAVDCGYSVIYDWNGFFRPIDNLPMWNSVKAGQAIPVKFSLGGDQGLNIFETGYPVSAKCNCDASAPLDEVTETVTAGQSSLSYDPITGEYNYVWKTEKAWAGTCRPLTVRLADGTDHVAKFKFTK
jgi:hypothetical protein